MMQLATSTEHVFAGLSKVELHVHVEGAAMTSRIDHFSRSRDPRHAFFEHWVELTSRLVLPSDFVMAARAFVEYAVSSQIVWVEAIISPSDLAKRPRNSISFKDGLRLWLEAFEGIVAPVEVRLVVDLVRMYGAECANGWLDDLLRARQTVKGRRLIGITLGGLDVGYSLKPFAGVYRRAREEGLICCVHAGEWAGVEDIRTAIEELRPHRIAHAIALSDDSSLYQQVLREGIGIEACPISNARTGAVPQLVDHPIHKWLSDGAPVSVNTDDPAIFGTSLAKEFLALHNTFGWGVSEVVRLLENAAMMSTMPERVRSDYLRQLRIAAAPGGQGPLGSDTPSAH